ncbi:MAG: hypothetical protein SNG59_03390 [Rikenellaceae bacterium]
MGSTSKPLGGIAALMLDVASPLGAAPTLPEGGVTIPLLEDRSTYSEVAEWIEGFKSVTHSLKAVTSIDYNLPEGLTEALKQGFVALIELNSSDQITVGWSTSATSHRALRLVSCTTQSEEKPSSRGYKEWLFESIDAQTNI